MVLTATACTKPFPKKACDIIGTTEEGIMTLCTVETTRDSLFLRQHCSTLNRKQMRSDLFETLMIRMLATVNDPHNPGVGIAAPQVGLSYRLVAVKRFDKIGEPFEFYANPQIIYYSPKTSEGREGCLSIPGYAGQVERSVEIVIRYENPADCKPKQERVKGYTAVIFQHEIDHLNGILYTDRASKVYRRE